MLLVLSVYPLDTLRVDSPGEYDNQEHEFALSEFDGVSFCNGGKVRVTMSVSQFIPVESKWSRLIRRSVQII